MTHNKDVIVFKPPCITDYQGDIPDDGKILSTGLPSPFNMKVSYNPVAIVADIKRRLDLIKEEIKQSDYDSWILNNKGWLLLSEPIGFGLVKADEVPYTLIDFIHCSEDDLQKKVEEIIDNCHSPHPNGKTMFAAVEEAARYGCYHLMDSLPACTGEAKTFNYRVNFYQPRKEMPPTVRGNSRQKIIDNGKHKWPEVKRKKGHR